MSSNAVNDNETKEHDFTIIGHIYGKCTLEGSNDYIEAYLDRSHGPDIMSAIETWAGGKPTIVGKWKWRFPDPIMDSFATPEFGGQYRYARFTFPGAQEGWVYQISDGFPPEPPSEKEQQKHEKRLRSAALKLQRAMGTEW